MADLVVENCSPGKRPALLLTRTPDITERWLINDKYHCLIVNIDNYLKASGDAATTYFSRLSSLDPVSALTPRPVEISTDEEALLDRLSPALLAEIFRGERVDFWLRPSTAVPAPCSGKAQPRGQ